MLTEWRRRLRGWAALCLCLAAFSACLIAQTAPARHGSYLGVRLVDVQDGQPQALRMSEAAGAFIVGVEENGSADQAGLHPGDVILVYNGENVLGAQQLGRLVMETPPGRKVRLQVWRDGKARELTLVTSSPPAYYATVGESSFQAPVTDVPAPLMVWKNLMLGLDYEPLSAQLAQFFGVTQGALIRSVDAGSVAERCGIKAGDVLTRVAGQSIATPRDIAPAMKIEQVSQKPLPVDVTRAHKSVSIIITFSER